MPQAMKIPAAKGSSAQKMGKLETISVWNLTKVSSKSEVIDEAKTNGSKVHFASLMDICHLKNAELEAKHQKYKGRVVLRGDIVKDDSGSYAVFTEQESSASQMTAAKVMDIISRLPGCAGQATDAVSALANKTTQQLYKVATPCMDDHQLKEEESESVGELSTFCSEIVLNCLFLARIGRPDILWSVNKHQEVSCLFSEVTRLCKQVGCVRKFCRS